MEGAEAGGAAQRVRSRITMELERQTQAGTSGTPGPLQPQAGPQGASQPPDHPAPLPCHVPQSVALGRLKQRLKFRVPSLLSSKSRGW